MSFLYPRIVSVRRPDTATGGGAQGYSGNLASAGTPIASGLEASIQLNRERGVPEAKTASDAYYRADWNIFIPNAAKGLITERDVVVDDLGKRYLVLAAYWNSLGYKLSADLLEA